MKILTSLFFCFVLLYALNGCDNKSTDLESNYIEDVESSLQSEITCPYCGHSKMETLPTEVCLIRYICENCKAELTPEDDDCCVFCTYGTHKCPSKQGK